MRTRLFALPALAALVALALPANALAVYGNGNLKTKKCGAGPLVVDVTENVINDADSGVSGNYWANDAYKRSIKVVQTGPGVFCAITTYTGTSITYAGVSPAGTETVSGGLKVKMSGGYRSAAFSAAFTPTKPTSGYLGTFDLQCDQTGNCANPVDWTSWYFNNGGGASFDFAYWGWQYKAKMPHGIWVNSILGNMGDISG